MSGILDALKDYFKREDWPFEEVEGQSALLLGYRSDGLAWTCYAQALEDDQQFVFYSVVPVTFDRTRRWLVAEYISRANDGLVLGNFEMDIDEGTLRFKTSIDVEGDRLSYALFRPVVYGNVAMMERYLPGLQAVIAHGASPRDVIHEIENGSA